MGHKLTEAQKQAVKQAYQEYKKSGKSFSERRKLLNTTCKDAFPLINDPKHQNKVKMALYLCFKDKKDENDVIDCDRKTAENLTEIEKSIFGTAWDSEVIKEKIDNRKFKYWIYEVENSIKGYLGIQYLEEEIEILGIGVSPGSRRKKIATELMDELITYFEKSDYRKIILEVRESNAVAQKLYRKYGFNKISKRKKYYVDEDAEVYLKEKIYV